MAAKRHTAEEIVTRLRQVDVLNAPARTRCAEDVLGAETARYSWALNG